MKRQKVLFIRDSYIFKILKNFMFVGLYIIALILILIHKVDLGILSGVSQGIFYITAPVIHTIELPAHGISLVYKKITELANLYEENKELRQKNEELFLLKEKINATATENALLKKLLHHIDTPDVSFYTARVIAENGNAFTNSLILYLGDDAPLIKTGYAVLNNSGLIGRIDMVSGAYAHVTLITDINSKIPVVSQNTRERGILTGNNTDTLKLIFTPLMADLHKKDLLVTSGVGGGLPPDIPVARIKKIGTEDITAVPLFSPSSLEIVKIIAYDVTPPADIKEN